MNKCQATTIRCTFEQVDHAIALFPYQFVDFPIKYLVMPLAPTKLPKSALQPLLDQVADRLLVWKGRLLRRSGRLTLIKLTLSAIPVYTSICLSLPPWLHKALQRIMTAFLWMGTIVLQAGKCLVSWKRVQRPCSWEGWGSSIHNCLVLLCIADGFG
jgi:hypothetical protein